MSIFASLQTLTPPSITNYKGLFSIVLLGVVDAKYKFIAYDLGAEGKAPDSGIWNGSQLKKRFENNSLKFPEPKQLQNGDESTRVHYVFVGEDAFALAPYIIKPFRHNDPTQSEDKRICSHWLSRTRRVVEIAFGILSNRFRVLMSAMHVDPKLAKIVVLASMALHNILLDSLS